MKKFEIGDVIYDSHPKYLRFYRIIAIDENVDQYRLQCITSNTITRRRINDICLLSGDFYNSPLF